MNKETEAATGGRILVYPAGVAAREGSACAAVIRHLPTGETIEVAARGSLGDTAQRMKLVAIRMALDALRDAGKQGQRVAIIEPTPWARTWINLTLRETLDKFGGRKASGEKIENAAEWEALREAAKPWGGLQCEGGLVEAVAPEGEADKRTLRNARGLARERLATENNTTKGI